MKKKITRFLCGLMLLSTFAGCSSSGSHKWELVEIPGYELGNEDTSTLTEQATTTVRFHYSRNDTGYSNWSLWCWDKSGTSGRFEFTHYDEFGVWGDVKLEDVQGENPTTELGFLIAIDPGGTWQAKDYESDRFVVINPTTPGGIQHVYLLSGVEKQYLNKESTKMHTINNSMITELDKIKVNFGIVKGQKFKFDEKNFEVTYDGVPVKNFKAVDYDEKKHNLILKFDSNIDLTKQIKVTYKFSKKHSDTTVPNYVVLFNSEKFEELYTYKGDDLGVTFDKELNPTSTTFKVWAPTSSKIVLNVYDDGDLQKQKEPSKTYEMTKGEKGVWAHTVNENLHGKYYTYTVTNSVGTNEVVDPYAKSAGINGIRGMIVDFNKVNSEIAGWSTDSRPEFGTNGTDASIYEIHVRDMTIDPDSNVTKEKRGTFAGLAEKGTSYTKGDVTVSTGLDHIKELGVTHVQILPFYDYNSVEERNVSTDMSMEVENSNYNWGYDPLNYNVLEGSYSTNPYDGLTRIKEFKEMVMAMHSYGINIIMDVVYNHTAKTNDSNFQLLVPEYYHRRSSTGELFNGSGCGNEMASDRSMVNKFVVDSARFWGEEYHLGGYRFDLMGLLDNKTMIDVYKECSSVYDKVMVYGEPWTGGTSKLKNGTDSNNLKNQQTVQASLGQSYFADAGNYVGAFNDQIRNAVRGDNAPSRGWVNGSTGSYGSIYAGVQGLFSTVNKEAENVEPQQVLNYVSCHDNYTLYDQLASNRIDSNDFNRTYKQAETMIFTAQGVPFLQEGEDFMRTKVNKRGTSGKYDHNSYNACDLTNHMDWSLKADNVEMFEYFKDLITFRKATPELTISTRDEITAAYSKTGDGKTIAYKFDLTSKEGNCIYVVHASEAVKHDLDGTYEVIFSNSSREVGSQVTSLDLVSNESVVLKKIG